MLLRCSSTGSTAFARRLSFGPKDLSLLDPLIADLLVGALDRRPGDAECGFLSAGVAGVRRVGVIERLAKNVLGMLGQMRANRGRQIGVDVVRHGGLHGDFKASS